VVFRPPANVLPTATLMPFTVYAEERPFGVPAGRATGLLTVAVPERIEAELAVASVRRRAARFTVSVTNREDTSLTVGFEARVDRPARVDTTPAVVDLAGRRRATATVRVRPRRAFVGAGEPYVLSLACKDASDSGLAPLATVEATGTATPVLGRGLAKALAALLLVVAVGAVLIATDVCRACHPCEAPAMSW
jgi:hypothetical protein